MWYCRLRDQIHKRKAVTSETQFLKQQQQNMWLFHNVFQRPDTQKINLGWLFYEVGFKIREQEYLAQKAQKCFPEMEDVLRVIWYVCVMRAFAPVLNNSLTS